MGTCSGVRRAPLPCATDCQGMNKWLILLCLLWSAAQAVPVYRWVDESGQVNYSDRPGPGAVRIELSTDAPSPNTGRSSPRVQSPALETRPSGAAGYESFVVIQPAPQETLWGTAGRVEVALGVSPDLQPRHRLGLYLDGVLADLETRATRFEIENVYRGEHTVQAVILDDTNKELLRSAPVTFFVQQTSIYYPRNPGRAR